MFREISPVKDKYKQLLSSFDLKIYCDFIDPEFNKETADITLKNTSNIGFVPTNKQFSDLSLETACIEDKLLLCTVNKGNEILYQEKAKIDKDKKIAKLFHQPLAYALFQRGFFVLHGSAVTANGKVYAFSGISKSGKSETIKFLSENYAFLSDDIVAINSENKNNICPPGLPFICAQTDNKKNIIDKRDRSLIWLENQRRERNTLELDSIFFLGWGEDNYIEEIGDVEAFHHLIPNSYRPLPNASCLESEKQYLSNISKVISNTNFYRFIRKRGDVSNAIKVIKDFI